jgi:hypothetical protein
LEFVRPFHAMRIDETESPVNESGSRASCHGGGGLRLGLCQPTEGANQLAM